MRRISKRERIELWLDRLQRQSQSCQTIAQFCTAEGVSAPSFYHWKRRLSATLAENRSPRTELVRLEPRAFSEIQIVGQVSPASVSLPSGIFIQLGTDHGVAAIITDRILQHACPASRLPSEPRKSTSC